MIWALERDGVTRDRRRQGKAPVQVHFSHALDASIRLAGCNNAHADGRNACSCSRSQCCVHSPLPCVISSLAPRTAISIVISEGGGGVLKMQGMRLRVNA